MPKVLVSPTTFCVFDPLPERKLKERGYDIVKNPYGRTLSPQETIELARDCVGVVAGTEKYTADVLSKLPLLKMISRVGIGMDSIDIQTAEERKIKVCRTVTEPTAAVAELVLGLILDGLRHISLHDGLLKKKRWGKTMGSLLEGKTLGIIGLGKIGKRMVKMTEPFGLRYLARDVKPDESFARANKVELCGLEKLLAESDIVTIHLSPTPEAKAMINYEKLKLMKPGALIVNTSRGEVIDEDGLLRALNEKRIAGAALDVFETEPYSGPLLDLENVVATPHVGAYAKEVRTKMELEAVENLLEGLGIGGQGK